MNAGPPLAPFAPFAPSRTPAVADPLAPGWHQGVTGTRRLLVAADVDHVSYLTPVGHSYRISAGAWMRWLGADA